MSDLLGSQGIFYLQNFGRLGRKMTFSTSATPHYIQNPAMSDKAAFNNYHDLLPGTPFPNKRIAPGLPAIRPESAASANGASSSLNGTCRAGRHSVALARSRSVQS
jgi:hypothetical protein